MVSHRDLDRRSRELHRLVVQKIDREPALFHKVPATLSRLRQIVDPRSHPYLDQWQALVDQGRDACLAKALEDSESADALRQCSPFTGILTNQERFEFLRQWRAKRASEAQRS